MRVPLEVPKCTQNNVHSGAYRAVCLCQVKPTMLLNFKQFPRHSTEPTLYGGGGDALAPSTTSTTQMLSAMEKIQELSSLLDSLTRS